MPYDIPLPDAATKTQQFQTLYSGNTKGLSFPRNEILEILGQPNCTGIRIYFGLNDSARPKDITVVIVGVKDNGSGDFLQAVDMINTGNKIKNSGNPCPPNCSLPANDLNR
ncbi:MAG: hypothetical protein K1X63_17035 [Chitinophagales bacterium]|nr:hypothetical protein [Bacteroidota bacterium]MBX7142781.1 hypothetical protein [Chitinophagales bacterium]